MALPGTLTLNSILLERITPENCQRVLQPETISASFTPDRSRYGTLQQPGVPTTNTAKYLWVISELFVPTDKAKALEDMAKANSTFSYSFTDNFWSTMLTGASYTTTVRLIVPSGQLFGSQIYLDRTTPTVSAFTSDYTNQFPVSFSLLEI